MRPIDADAMKARLRGCMILMPNGEKCTAERAIDTQGTIDAKPVRHGRWEYRHADDWMFCTACGTDAEGNYDEPLETDFCPHCGADMREGGADNA